MEKPDNYRLFGKTDRRHRQKRRANAAKLAGHRNAPAAANAGRATGVISAHE
ncbi:MAG: hypothetical protein IPL72_06770 [Sulfuritalea sp.]|nr:hypothetical protein [Sulfuritalea sp.]